MWRARCGSREDKLGIVVDFQNTSACCAHPEMALIRGKSVGECEESLRRRVSKQGKESDWVHQYNSFLFILCFLFRIFPNFIFEASAELLFTQYRQIGNLW